MEVLANTTVVIILQHINVYVYVYQINMYTLNL